MKYVNERTYDYIINKYHDTTKPFDPHNRFIRRDELFCSESGMAPDEIMAGILTNDKQYDHLGHPIRKARALEYVLENTRISCDERDIFPAINMIDRPLSKTLIKKWSDEVFGKIIPEVEARRAQLELDGIVTMWPDYDHSVPFWDRLFRLGLSGILSESEQARTGRALTEDEQDFFEGIRITYEAALALVERLYEAATTEKMKFALHDLHVGAPQSFYEALLLSYIYFIISEHVDNLQVRSLSGFDRSFYRFYQGDLARGVSEQEIRHDLACYFLQFTAIGNYWNQPVYLGGEHADGTTVINDLSYLFLDVYDEMNLYNPKIQIKVSSSTPKDFLCRALDMIRCGKNSIVFVSDIVMRHALERVGVSPDEARECNVTGCYEYSAQGSYHTAMNYLNLLKPLEYALHKGHDGVSGAFGGLRSPTLSEYTSFDSLYEEYKRQLRGVIDAAVETGNAFEGYLDTINPLSLLSATFPRCLSSARHIIGDGPFNDTVISFGFLADTVDSLSMIQKYVFERKELSLGELVAMLDGNYEGNDVFRRRLLSDREKWGNNKDRPDALATDLVNFITENLCGRPNARGGNWSFGFHIARMSYVQAPTTAACASGRRCGDELSKNISAAQGQNREGATAAILSITKLDATSFVGGDAALDLGLLPSAVSGDDGLEAMYGLLMTFIRRGGHALHINVFDAATLRDAQKHPERYRDLQIRVSGWSVLWNNINPKEQEGFIRQAEALS